MSKVMHMLIILSDHYMMHTCIKIALHTSYICMCQFKKFFITFLIVVSKHALNVYACKFYHILNIKNFYPILNVSNFKL